MSGIELKVPGLNHQYSVGDKSANTTGQPPALTILSLYIIICTAEVVLSEYFSHVHTLGSYSV